MTAFQEQRKHQRLLVKIEISFSSLAHLKASYTREISKGGLLFHCQQELPRDSVYDFALNIPNQTAIQLQGKVVHIQPIPQEMFAVGIEFINLTKEQKQLMIQLTEKLIDDATLNNAPLGVKMEDNSSSNTASPMELDKELKRLERQIKIGDAYELLGVRADASTEMIDSAYQRLTQRLQEALQNAGESKELSKRLVI